MNAAVLMMGVLGTYAVAYRAYGKFLSRRFEIDPQRKTPAHTKYDGNDYVPAKNWWVLFGHHFSSICGAGPIVGPALACAYWGWGISVVWIVVGATLMGAVSDFSSLVVSVRHEGKSISEVSGLVISKRLRLYFSIFLWISLILVIAVFAIFGAKTLKQAPSAILPSVGLIPTALLTGWLLYVRKVSNLWGTLVGLSLLLGLLILGNKVDFNFNGLLGLSLENTWIVLLLAYCFIASVVPVQVLLQPRDYLASFILFAMIGCGVLAVLITQPTMQGNVFNGFSPSAWPQAGPLWPMLFVTIACGAISGFHSLVSSGTTCKQLSSEGHACRIGYGGMLVESLVGILVVIAVGAGLKSSDLVLHLKGGGPIAAFSHGYGSVTQIFLGDYGTAFAVLALNAFILTTLDSATRITRYLTTELFGIQNKYLATLLVVVASALMALTGQWNILWPAFGASNQLIAGIALLIASCWLLARGKKFWITFIPACLMLVTTLAAFGYQFFQAISRKSADGDFDPNVSLAIITFGLIVISFLMTAESLTFMKKKHGFEPALT